MLRGSADKEVLSYGQARNKGTVLEYREHSGALRIAWRLCIEGLPGNFYVTSIRLHCAAHDSDKGGLAGTILANQRMNFAWGQCQTRVLKCAHDAIRLGEATRAQQHLARHSGVAINAHVGSHP
jgi:hypothetical protein